MKWHVINNPYGVFVMNCSKGGENIATMTGDFSREDKLKQAQLMATAPELLEALIGVWEMLEGSRLAEHDACQNAKTIINKAKEIL